MFCNTFQLYCFDFRKRMAPNYLICHSGENKQLEPSFSITAWMSGSKIHIRSPALPPILLWNTLLQKSDSQTDTNPIAHQWHQLTLNIFDFCLCFCSQTELHILVEAQPCFIVFILRGDLPMSAHNVIGLELWNLVSAVESRPRIAPSVGVHSIIVCKCFCSPAPDHLFLFPFYFFMFCSI